MPHGATRAGEPWRAELVRRSGQVILLFSLVIAAYVWSRDAGWAGLAAYASLVGGGAVATWGSRLSLRLRGSLLVGVLLLAGGVAAHALGLVPGTLLCPALATVLSTVLFGSRAGYLVLAASGLLFLVLGAAGRLETTAVASAELLQMGSWYRMAAVYVVLTGLLVILVSGALRRVEASLLQAQESEERWRRISEASFEGIAFSEGGLVVDANEQLARMLGYEPSELIGKPLLELLPADGRDAARPRLARRKDGSLLPVESQARLLASRGRALRVTVVRDMSEQVRLQRELAQRERLAAVGEVVAGVAHEVRTPLFGISATLDAHQPDLEPSAENRRLFEVLRAQVERLSRVMTDLLDYGRPPELRLARGRLGGLIEAALRSCAGQAAAAGVSLLPPVAGALPELDLDAERLEQVFHNLLSNAISHSPRGGQVRVQTSWSDAPPGVTCTVEDEGPGVEEADMARVFQPFFSRRKGGTGLGLAIVQRVVEQHGGWVRVGRRPGGGAAFSVFLPAPPPAASARTG